MDTKWRKFSRSRAVKVLLVILCLACFGAVGIITGYAPAHGYDTNNYVYSFNSMFADSYTESASYEELLMSSYYTTADLFMNEYSQSVEGYRNFSRQMAELPFYAAGVIGGKSTVTSGKSYDHVFRVQRFGYAVHQQMKSDSAMPSSMKNHVFETHYLPEHDDYIEFGFTNEQLAQYEKSWRIMRYNMQVIVCSSLGLIVAALLLLALLCCVSGENADGTARWSSFFALPYEVSIAAFAVLIAFYGWMMLDINDCLILSSSQNGRTFLMFLFGVVALAIGAMLMYLLVSYSIRRKNKTALRGSIICMLLMLVKRVVKFCFSLLKRLFRFVKEALTGEFYSYTVAKKLIFLDAAFIAATMLLAVFVLALEAVPLMLLEVVFLGLFLYGRILIIKDLAHLENQIDKIHSGDYDYRPQLHKNSPFIKSSEQLAEISVQYRKGIEESVKAERTKMELVTNVSHDLKTPLTSIIGYIELLSKQDLPEEAAEHVRILQVKSERLKTIVSDVFELAKTTSGEIKVERELLDLTKLSYQTLGEMEDKISSSGLAIKVNICEPPVTVISDGKRLYRVIQNLLDNALKYSLKGTRIYYTLLAENGRAVVTIKNIASYEMNFTKEEILERFTRGDKARSTEGSGLGLSIAQGFTLACGGSFDVDIDGDMFKVTLSFPTVPAKNKEAVTVDE